MIRLLSVNEIMVLHRKLIEQTGGGYGVRDQGLIESAVNRASVTFDGQDLYRSDQDKIAAITYGIINNHGFIDGNKRLGIAAMLLLARLNGIQLEYSQSELVSLGLNIADGKLDETGIVDWLANHKK